MDLREHGSKNIGATNAFRVLGGRWGAIVFALDLLKGLAAVFASRLLATSLPGAPDHVLPSLLLPLALPAASADHATICGSPDGYLIEPFVAVWLEPGCLGAAAGLGNICRPVVTVFHGQVLEARGYASNCGAGAWLP